jgi:hypothetical protein
MRFRQGAQAADCAHRHAEAHVVGAVHDRAVHRAIAARPTVLCRRNHGRVPPAPHPSCRPPHVPLFPGAVQTNIASGHGTAVSSSWVLLGCSSDLSLSLVLHRLSPCRSHRAQPMPSHLCRYTHAALGGCSVHVSCVRSRDHTTTGERGLCGVACTLTEPPRPGSGRPRCCVTLHAALVARRTLSDQRVLLPACGLFGSFNQLMDYCPIVKASRSIIGRHQ